MDVVGLTLMSWRVLTRSPKVAKNLIKKIKFASPLRDY
jgi:hypothetical protein